MTRARKRPARATTAWTPVALVAGVQILFGAFFVYELLSTIFGWRSAPISWTWRETLEIMAAAGLLLGMAMGLILLRTLIRQGRHAEERLRRASGQFFAVVQDRFDTWNLTPAERDVALFMLKGLSNAEIAKARDTSEGTVKAHSTGVFRKAGVSGRAQLMSEFIEDLLEREEPSA